MLSFLKSYAAVIALFALAFFMSLSLTSWLPGRELSGATLAGSMGFFVSFLAFLKIIDLTAFLESFRRYDLLAARLKIYGMLYPLLELTVGLCFLAAAHNWVVGVLACLLGVVGSISIILKLSSPEPTTTFCACTGGRIQVPLGALSVAENLAMVVMGVMMIL